MYLSELRSIAPRTLAITCGVILISSAIAAWPEGWGAMPTLLAFRAAAGVCIGFLFWLGEPLIKTYSAGMRLPWRWTFRIVSWTAVLNAGILCGNAVLASLGILPWERYLAAFWEGFLPGTLICTICCTAFTIHEGLKYQAQSELAKARLASLESRLRPHFLFNTLNSIAALIPEDPALAERVTVKLADLLRYSLDSAECGTVRLEQELKVMTDYLEIQQTRFGERLRYSVDVPSALLATEIPPFSLQTLVDNSVKYGGSEIRISAREHGGKLTLTVWDSGKGFNELTAEVPGHGPSYLRKRLAALWGSKAALVYPRCESGVAAEIVVPSGAAPFGARE